MDSIVLAVIACASVLTRGAQSIETKGTDFILAFREKTRYPPVLHIMNEEDDPATVTISTPEAHNDIQHITVKKTEAIWLVRSNTPRGDGSQPVVVLVKSNTDVSVQGFIKSPKSLSAFLALPLQELGTEYVVVTYCRDAICRVTVVGTQDDTLVVFQFKIAAGGTVKIHDDKFKSGDVLQKTLKQYETLVVACDKDISGSSINTNRPVAVFSGAGVRGSKVIMIEQLIPLKSLGTQYVLPFLPNLPSHYASTIKVIALNPQTVVHVGTFVFKLRVFECQKVSLQATQLYTLNANFPVLVAFIVENYNSSHGRDGSLSIVYPTDDKRELMHQGESYRVRGLFPNFTDAIHMWFVAVTDEHCDLRASSLNRKVASTRYSINGFYFTKWMKQEIDVKPPGACTVLSGVLWLLGDKHCALSPWLGTHVKPKKERPFFCNTKLWVHYVLSKRRKKIQSIYDFARGRKECCF